MAAVLLVLGALLFVAGAVLITIPAGRGCCALGVVAMAVGVDLTRSDG